MKFILGEQIKIIQKDYEAIGDSLGARAVMVIGTALFPTTLYVTFIGQEIGSELFLLIMWPPVLMGLGVLYYTIIRNFNGSRPYSHHTRPRKGPDDIVPVSYVGRCPQCNGKVFVGDENCRWCGWEVLDDRLRAPI